MTAASRSGAGPVTSRQDSVCDFSILIGLVGREDRERIYETLDALRTQRGEYGYEVLIADRRQDDVSHRIRTEYPEARLIPCPPHTSLPELRRAALEQASGRYVLVTEDHCVPSRDWLQSVMHAFARAPADSAAVGGCVENGLCDRPLDWATFLCEYSAFLAPVTEGPTRVLPGVNVAYRREILASIEPELLERGFWETTLHPVLLRRGWTLFSTSRMCIYHRKKFSLGMFSRQRFIYSRYYAGTRFAPGQRLHRSVALIGSVLLPCLLLSRIGAHLYSKKRWRVEYLAALPSLALFTLIWAAGEMTGYLLGPGDALQRIE